MFIISEGLDATGVTAWGGQPLIRVSGSSKSRLLLMIMGMAISIAAAAFLTPVATPVNLMVMGPAGYKFGDYWKLGLPLMLWFFIVAIFLVPLIWPL